MEKKIVLILHLILFGASIIVTSKDKKNPQRYAHTILKGDNLYKVSKKSGVSVAKLKNLNPRLDPSNLQLGSSLFLRKISLMTGGKRLSISKEDLNFKNTEIIIYKKERELQLIIMKTLIRTYKIALGKEPKGDKRKEGDQRTPEGKNYYVCQRLGQGNYGPSLGVSYPSKKDALIGLREKRISQFVYKKIIEKIQRKEKPPWSTPLGGAICIHGKGNGVDWTAGCIALNDDDASELFALVPMRTPIKIFANKKSQK